MAVNEDLSAKQEITSVTSGDDLFYAQKAAGTPKDKKIKRSNLFRSTVASNSEEYGLSEKAIVDYVATQLKSLSILNKSANFIIADDDGIGLFTIDLSSSSVTGTLPTVADNIGRIIKCQIITGHATNIFTLGGEGSETINSILTQILRSVNDYIEVIGTSSGWLILKIFASWTDGWLQNEITGAGSSDWTDVILGTDPTDGTSNFNHKLGINLSDYGVDHKLLISSDGAENNVIEFLDMSFETSLAPASSGISVYQIDTNNLAPQTGSIGIAYIDSSGLRVKLDTADTFRFKNVITRTK